MHYITSWFFVEDDNVGNYAQMQGNPRDEEFRDIYRRCILIFFLSARRANPFSELILYLNRDWDTDVSAISREVFERLTQLGVRIEIVRFNHEPPPTFTKNWRNQFFVFDVIASLSGILEKGDAYLLLDSDIVWSSTSGAQTIWEKLEKKNCVLPLGFDEGTTQNGLSPKRLAKLLSRSDSVRYFGGELIGGPQSQINLLQKETESVYRELMAKHHLDNALHFEEAHVLSAAYQQMLVTELDPFDAKRMWTQPLKYQNVVKGDESVTLWHLPAEKRYGFKRLYDVFVSDINQKVLLSSDDEFNKLLRTKLGVPKNSLTKWVLDVAHASLGRVREFILK